MVVLDAVEVLVVVVVVVVEVEVVLMSFVRSVSHKPHLLLQLACTSGSL